MATKGTIIDNSTGKHFHVVSCGGERRNGAWENPFKPGTDLAPGGEHRWEQLWVSSGAYAWMTYAADDGTQVTIKTYDNFWNTGYVDSVQITNPNGVKPVTYDIGYKNSANLVTLK